MHEFLLSFKPNPCLSAQHIQRTLLEAQISAAQTTLIRTSRELVALQARLKTLV
jgi:hypothetical protein